MGERDFFSVSGQVVVRARSGEQHEWAGAWVQVLDRDHVLHDLIAEGPTRADGSFEVEFTTSEFNLEPFEVETWPEVWIVVSRRTEDGDLVPVDSFGVPPGSWKEQTAELGEIVVDEWTISIETVEIVPSARRRSVDRLELSPGLVESLAARVQDDVAELTGWTELSDGVRFEVSDDIATTLARQSGLEFGRIGRTLVNMVAGSVVWAFYDPVAHMIVVHPRCATLNSEGLKVLLGHELVHVGQFRECHDLLDRMRAGYEDLMSQVMEQPLGEFAEVVLSSDLQAIGTEIEGHATWTHHRLAERNPLAMPMEHDGSIARRLLAALAFKAGFGPKVQQYADGVRLFEQRAAAHGRAPQLASWLLSGSERAR